MEVPKSLPACQLRNFLQKSSIFFSLHFLTHQVPYLLCCLGKIALSLFNIHPTEVFISRSNASSHLHSGKLIQTASSSIPSYNMLSTFLTISWALVNLTFCFYAIIFDPGWSNYTCQWCMCALFSLQEITCQMQPGIPEILAFLSCWLLIYDVTCVYLGLSPSLPSQQRST